MSGIDNLKSRPKGRPKGSVNKVSIALRNALEEKGFDVTQKLIDLYLEADADPDKFSHKKEILFRILKYTHPQIKELDLSAPAPSDENNKPVTMNLQDLVKIAKGDTLG